MEYSFKRSQEHCLTNFTFLPIIHAEREREREETDRQKERDVAREDGRRERERRPREGERDGGGAMETHNTYTDT